jgi:cobalamin biosynthesis protein CobT
MSKASASNNTSAFMHETRKVSRTIGRDANIEVVFSGNAAKTDGSTIYLPSLPSDHAITHDQAGALRGYTDHESFHVRKTDMKLWESTMKAGEGAPDFDKFEAWAQAIEDMRIERFGTEEYPGAKRNISNTVDELTRINMEKLRADPSLGASKDAAGPLAVTCEGRRRMDISPSSTTETLDMLSADVRSVANGVVDYINGNLRDGKEGTSDTLALAYYIAKHGEAPPKSEPPESLPQPSFGSGSGSGSDDSDKGSAEKPGAGKGGEDTGEPGGGHKADSAATSLNTELSDIVEKAAREVVDTERADGLPPLTVMYPELDMFYKPVEATGNGNTYNPKTQTYHAPEVKGIKSFEQSIHSSAGQMSVMRRKLERMVQAKANRGWERGLESGSLDPKRLTMAAMGVPTVWRRREAVPEIDTSVLLLIDLSGSMNGPPVALAQDVAIALSTCLSTIGIEHAVVGFSNRCIRAPRGREYEYARYESLQIPVFKDFDQSLRMARASMGSIKNMAGGNNSDPCAINMAWDKLRERQSKRRIMLTISDGAPAWSCPQSSSVMGGWTKAAVQRVTREGGECAGIGLMDDSVQKFYPFWTVANSMEEFAGKSMDMLARMLLGERVRVSAAA